MEAGSSPGQALVLVSGRASIKHNLLQNTRDALNQLEAELQNIDARQADGHLYLACRWHRLEVAVKLGRLQYESTHSKDEASATAASIAREHALQEAEVKDR